MFLVILISIMLCITNSFLNQHSLPYTSHRPGGWKSQGEKGTMSVSDQQHKISHVAVIVDGNGRWASARGMSRSEGHRIGANKTMEMARYIFEEGIDTLTLFLFSTENWRRPIGEIQNIMELLEEYLTTFSGYLVDNNIRVEVIGQKDRLRQSAFQVMKNIENRRRERLSEADGVVAANKTLCLAISYGGRDDIVQACRSITQSVEQGLLRPTDVTEDLFSQYTYTGRLGIPDPDLIIRTSGENRISNFLLWQCAYAEFAVIDCFWPDITEAKVGRALSACRSRERRYGGISSSTTLPPL